MFADEAIQGENHLDYLLNCSGFSNPSKSIDMSDLSLAKDKLNLTQKQKTREQGYDEIMNQVHQTKLEQIELKKQLQKLKAEAFKNYLSKFQEEFDEFNRENIRLRAELPKTKKKVSHDRSERLSNRSSLKPRTSINSLYGEMKTQSKRTNKQNSPNLLLKKKQAKMAESTANLYGRGSLRSPRHHKCRESQRTERKLQDVPVAVSMNGSYIQDKCESLNIRESMSKNYLRVQSQKNVFVEILENILMQQKIYQKNICKELEQELSFDPLKSNQNGMIVNDLEDKIKETHEKIQMLSLISRRYQADIQGMNLNLGQITQLTQKLVSVKGKYIEMERRCAKLGILRREVSDKEERLSVLKSQLIKIDRQQSRSMASVEALIRIVTNNPHKKFSNKQSKLYCYYYNQIRQLFKIQNGDQYKRITKMGKVRELIDNIRAGRKKFNELIQIYEGRIVKLQEKINRLKVQNDILRSK